MKTQSSGPKVSQKVKSATGPMFINKLYSSCHDLTFWENLLGNNKIHNLNEFG